MRFSQFPKNTVETVSPQRLAAARRFVAAQREKFALFPEMMEDSSAEVRAARIIIARRESWQEFRDAHAKAWRQARRELTTLEPLVRAGVLAYWAKGPLPGDPGYLRTIIAEAKRGVSYWHKLVEVRRMFLISRGRLPNPWARAVPEGSVR